MKTKLTALVLTLALLLGSFALVSCGGDETPTPGNDIPASGTINLGGQDMTFFSAPLNPEPVAPKDNKLQLVDAYTDGTYNYYLLDAGYVRHAYIETMGQVRYDGRTPAEISISISESSSVEKSITNTLSKSYTYGTSNSTSGEVGIGGSWPISGRLSFNYTGQTSLTTDKSVSDSVSTAQQMGQTLTANLSVGHNDEKPGFYRLALMGTMDVWVVCKTDINNETLISSEISGCLRESKEECYYSIIYSESGDFNVSPTDTIEIAEDYYKDLPRPTKVGGQIVVEKAYIPTTPLSCKPDNTFNYTETDPMIAENPHFADHSFSFGQFVVDGGGRASDGRFVLLDDSAMSISFRLEYDVDNLPIADAQENLSMTSRYLQATDTATGFYDMPFNIGSRTPGVGMIVARISYADGTPEDRICLTDAFVNAKAGDIITIKDGITKACTVEISICYEMCSWIKFLNTSGGSFYTQWRINQDFTVVPIDEA